MRASDAKEWRNAIESEYNSLMLNKTWSLCKLPPGHKAITSKWVFKKKIRANGKLDKYKARIVARGYTQKHGIDYQETFSPLVRLKSVRILLALAAQFELDLISFDIKTAYLHGTLEGELYMCQPEGFVSKKGNEQICPHS